MIKDVVANPLLNLSVKKAKELIEVSCAALNFNWRKHKLAIYKVRIIIFVLSVFILCTKHVYGPYKK